MGFNRAYWAWCEEAKERYDERLAIFSDGVKVTWPMDRIARMEARRGFIDRLRPQAKAALRRPLSLNKLWKGLSVLRGEFSANTPEQSQPTREQCRS
jgi:hypothetical protein